MRLSDPVVSDDQPVIALHLARHVVVQGIGRRHPSVGHLHEKANPAVGIVTQVVDRYLGRG